MRRALAWTHATFGIVLALYMLIAAGSGTAMVFRWDMIAWAHPGLAEAPAPADPISTALELEERIGEPIRAVRFPDGILNAFTVYSPDATTAIYHPATLERQPDRYNLIAAQDWLFDLHHHLLAGHTGETLTGIFALALLGMVVTGLILWWPSWRRWRLRNAWPRASNRTQRLKAHMTLSVLAVPTLLLATLTGSGMVFHDPTRAALTGMLGGATANPAPVSGADDPDGLASRQFAAADPRMLIPPPEPGAPYIVRLRGAGEAHPNGRTTIAWDPVTRRVIEAHDSMASGAGHRAADLLYPLHTGRVGGLVMRLLVMAGGIVTILSTVLAVGAYLKRKRRRRREAITPATAET